MTDSLKSADLENTQLSYFLSFPFAHLWWWKRCIDVFSDCNTRNNETHMNYKGEI